MKVAIVPAFNEEKTIDEVVKRLKKLNFEVIVVDDGSRDKTYEIAKKSGAIVIKHKKNKGKGFAIKTGIEYVIENLPNTKYIILIDADLQHLPEEAPRLIKKLEEGYDLVKGYRSWKDVPFRHKLGNYFWSFLFFLFFGKYIRDLGNGYIAMKFEAAKILRKVLSGGYIIEAKILKECIKNNLKLGFVPVTVKYYRKSRILRGIKVVFGVVFWIIKEGLKYRLSNK
ncbi:MAG: glycosyltransferase family 2 protein [Candidatus Aenigmatarchaeota archaeon]